MDITNNNPAFFFYTNPTEVNRQEISYTTYNYINPENYFNQPYNENITNTYDIKYLPETNEISNNNPYKFSETINSEKNNQNYFNYIDPSNSEDYISNIDYNNRGNINNTVKSNFATVMPLQISIKDKGENINSNYYYNNNLSLNHSKNVNNYSNDTSNYYIGLNTSNNLESNPISSITNNINNINLNENNNNYVIDDNFTFNDKIIYVPMSKNTNNISYNTTSNTNTVINNNMNKPIIKNKENILDYYQIKNIERTRIKLYNYLSGYYDEKIVSIQYGNSIKEEERNKYDSDFTKDTLNNNFLHYLEKLKVKCSNDYLVYYFKNYKENQKNDSNLYIDIFCPFFNLLSTQEYFIDLFTIPIDMPFIKKIN